MGYTLPKLTHTQYIQRLYKRSLKLALDWHVTRDVWRKEALNIRSRFEANRGVSAPKDIRALIQKTEAELEERSHPDPHIWITAPEGTKWERFGVQKPIFFKSTYKEE
ncbi:hypothetical protein K502DRAFT_345811 [Neoconidiobolus thromboides FSU 785]|nr:hypothetical protein K502DRAFT_345811 [Neoconidiobolus thromboides FSU 785]